MTNYAPKCSWQMQIHAIGCKEHPTYCEQPATKIINERHFCPAHAKKYKKYQKQNNTTRP